MRLAYFAIRAASGHYCEVKQGHGTEKTSPGAVFMTVHEQNDPGTQSWQ